ncbi:hydrogenase nickel incorporation protein HypB [Streptomyces sp. NPDC006879]|uniref:hydrogenase nickel incorporation protein HypB n=1 Tax=Streptomyces sp. NPDC006879 TaxID=3364767 RepID=UPI00367B6121
MCKSVDLHQAVLAKNDERALVLRDFLDQRGTLAVNLMSSPGSGKTALLEVLLTEGTASGMTSAAVTADLATENDATRLARSGAPVQQILTDGLCHLEAGMLHRRLQGWLPENTDVLWVENVGNLVCPASYDLGETLRIVLFSVTEGEDKPLKYPTAFGLAHLIVVTKSDIAQAVGFEEDAFLDHVEQVNPEVPIHFTSARSGQGVGSLLARVRRYRAGEAVHRPVLAGAHAHLLHHRHEAADPADSQPRAALDGTAS